MINSFNKYYFHNGSITVFLTLCFVIIFSLIIALVDISRIKISSSYVHVAGQNAAMTAFGNYNLELFNDYGLLAYGGYEGKDKNELMYVLSGEVYENLKEKPEDSKIRYLSLFGFEDIKVNLKNVNYLCDEDEFMREMKNYALKENLSKLKDSIMDTNLDNSNELNNLQGEVTEGKDYYLNKSEEENENTDDNDGKANNNNENDDKNKQKQASKELDNDEAGGNPIKFFVEFMKKGALSFVCDEDKIPDKLLDIDKIDSTDKGEDSSKMFDKKQFKDIKNDEEGGTEVIDNLLGEQVNGTISSATEKLSYICWADNELECYLDDIDDNPLSLEYVICGNKKISTNLLSIASRLMAIRLAVNMIYVYSDQTLQEKSNITAGLIASATLTPELEPVYSAMILFILAMEESIIDVRALLKGKEIPLIKSTENFKMKYSEICLGTPDLFDKKASQYEDSDNTFYATTKGMINYKTYLNVFLLMIGNDKLTKRSCEIVSANLKERYNDTFNIVNCVTGFDANINYKLPFLFIKTSGKNAYGNVNVSYQYY